MNETEQMDTEVERVRAMLGNAVAAVEAENGDLRFFAAALLTAAVQMHVEIEGVEGMRRALSRLAFRQLPADDVAGRA